MEIDGIVKQQLDLLAAASAKEITAEQLVALTDSMANLLSAANIDAGKKDAPVATKV